MVLASALLLLAATPQSISDPPVYRLDDPSLGYGQAAGFLLPSRGDRGVYWTSWGAVFGVRFTPGARPELVDAPVSPLLSPDGRWAAFARSRATWVVPTSGHVGPTRLASTSTPLKFLPGGRLLYRQWFRGPSMGPALWSVDPDQPGSDVLLGDDVLYDDGARRTDTIVVSPDGERLILANRVGRAPLWELEIAPTDASLPARSLGVNILRAEDLSLVRFTRDGQVLTCLGNLEPDQAPQLIAVPLDGRRPHALRELDEGTLVDVALGLASDDAVYLVLEDERAVLYRVSLEGGRSTRLITGSPGQVLGGLALSALSPDGRHALLTSSMEIVGYEGPFAQLEFDVLSVAVDGVAAPLQLNEQRAGPGSLWTDRHGILHTSFPLFSSTGPRVLFSEGPRLISADVSGSTPPVELTNEGGNPAHIVQFTADGRAALFWRRRGLRHELVLAHLDGTRDQVLLRGAASERAAGFTSGERGVVAIADLGSGSAGLYLISLTYR
jgi:hypothetical protein